MDRIQIIDYIMSTPHNVNWNVLSTMLDEGDWSGLKAYVEQTPHNMNRKVLEALLGEEEPISYRTVLYTDGTFIINESSKNQAANETLHGEATNVYEPFDPNGDTDIKKYIFADAFQRPWSSQASSVKIVEIGSNIQPTNTAHWFETFATCTSMNLDNLDTSLVTDMSYMFAACQALTSLDLSSFVTSSVTDMNYMFVSCQALASLNLNGFVTSSVINMNAMFADCQALVSLDLSSFVTSSVTDMANMFGSCQALTSLDVTHFDTSSVTNMSNMFNGCQALTSLDVSSFNTSAVTKMTNIFKNCYVLTIIYTSSAFVVTQVTNSANMFANMSTNLVGGAGTVWSSSSPKDKTYAHIDGGTSNPGYFTAKA